MGFLGKIGRAVKKAAGGALKVAGKVASVASAVGVPGAGAVSAGLKGVNSLINQGRSIVGTLDTAISGVPKGLSSIPSMKVSGAPAKPRPPEMAQGGTMAGAPMMNSYASGMSSVVNTAQSASGLPSMAYGAGYALGNAASAIDLQSLVSLALQVPQIMEMFSAVSGFLGTRIDGAYRQWTSNAKEIFANWVKGEYDELPNLPARVDRNQLAQMMPFLPPVIQAPEVTVRKAPKGYAIVNYNGNVVAMKKEIARSMGLYKNRKKAPITALEYNALKTADRVERKIKTMNKLAGLRVPTKAKR